MHKKILQIAGLSTKEERREILRRKLINREAQIGGKLFGPLPKGVSRQFFCLDDHTWVWYEQWLDKSNKLQTRTTRYEVGIQGIMKAQDGQPHQLVGSIEAARLIEAVHAYKKRVKNELYQAVATTN